MGSGRAATGAGSAAVSGSLAGDGTCGASVACGCGVGVFCDVLSWSGSSISVCAGGRSRGATRPNVSLPEAGTVVSCTGRDSSLGGCGERGIDFGRSGIGDSSGDSGRDGGRDSRRSLDQSRSGYGESARDEGSGESNVVSVRAEVVTGVTGAPSLRSFVDTDSKGGGAKALRPSPSRWNVSSDIESRSCRVAAAGGVAGLTTDAADDDSARDVRTAVGICGSTPRLFSAGGSAVGASCGTGAGTTETAAIGGVGRGLATGAVAVGAGGAGVGISAGAGAGEGWGGRSDGGEATGTAG